LFGLLVKFPELVSVFIGASGNLKKNLLTIMLKKKLYKPLALKQIVLIYFFGFQKNGHLIVPLNRRLIQFCSFLEANNLATETT
jgi:hypothetical protein